MLSDCCDQIAGLKLPPPTTSQTMDSSYLKTNQSTCAYCLLDLDQEVDCIDTPFLLFLGLTDKVFKIPERAVEYGSELEQRRSWNAVDFGSK
jgi:hypothetical protein